MVDTHDADNAQEGRTPMSTLFVENDPVVEALLARRRELGLDGKDEVWEGVYHVAPHEHGRNGVTAMALVEHLNATARRAGLQPGGSFNLGEPGDFRVPDLGFHRAGEPSQLYYASAALVIEVLSPRDETFAKFGFYAARGVEEVWVVDPLTRSVRIWQLDPTTVDYRETGSSDLLGLTATSVAEQLAWPEG
ncbi:Endonuclease, Uma2 family (restriction endonuclease fold) [Quadrisphaera granulorum]|uniref:Uma2 family endonuclease n=1 Tax=Quadrisphaera granulorum TaxID=317664 RepID=A0A316ABV8_9ACTN|nr:Uma2 family endonuclease [Quadrisphaera granulorum]PWJ55101.1 Uma2 family endonuclease [Quadrisphaera granulorum]SZE95610.1 Endonuclease, Uma2 family (restriction endonuclease fold) [Quadrisphaera granulorum]